MGPERPVHHVLPRSRRPVRREALHDRYHRPGRADRADPDLRLRPDLVAAPDRVARQLRTVPGRARRHGVIPARVLEAAEPGFGASGRNNGQVIPTLSRADPDAIVARHGAAGERFVALLRDSAALLFDLARRHAIDAEAEQAGWVQPAHSPGRIRISEARVRQWSRWGAPVALLDCGEVRAMTGSDAWHGGFWNRSGGHINPLALTRGLAGAALAAGAVLADGDEAARREPGPDDPAGAAG